MGIPVQGHCDTKFAEIRGIFEKSFDGDEENEGDGASRCIVPGDRIQRPIPPVVRHAC